MGSIQDPTEEQRGLDSSTRSPRLASSWETEVALKKQCWHHWVPSEFVTRRKWAKGHMASRGVLIPQVRLKARVGGQPAESVRGAGP